MRTSGQTSSPMSSPEQPAHPGALRELLEHFFGPPTPAELRRRARQSSTELAWSVLAWAFVIGFIIFAALGLTLLGRIVFDR